MLWNLWAKTGSVGFAVYAAFFWIFLTGYHWAVISTPAEYFRDDEHWLYFFVHILVAIVGAIVTGIRTYKLADKVWNIYAAHDLYTRWIWRRSRREMAQYNKKPK